MDGHLKFVALTVFVAVCSADWQDGNDGVDRLNGDLLNMPISLKAGARPRDCAQLCYANTQCKVGLSINQIAMDQSLQSVT